MVVSCRSFHACCSIAPAASCVVCSVQWPLSYCKGWLHCLLLHPTTIQQSDRGQDSWPAKNLTIINNLPWLYLGLEGVARPYPLSWPKSSSEKGLDHFDCTSKWPFGCILTLVVDMWVWPPLPCKKVYSLGPSFLVGGNMWAVEKIDAN
jgi:hypothetical protein